MERIYFSQNDNILSVEGCTIELPYSFLENWQEWILKNYGPVISKILNDPKTRKQSRLSSNISFRAVVRKMPLHIHTLCSIAVNSPAEPVWNGSFFQTVSGESMTDFLSKTIRSDDSEQEITVPAFMEDFIHDLEEAKQAPVTLAEFIQAMVNKVFAFPELWDMVSISN